ncbi:MAG TPA: NUDIX domain-containing protein [Streptosporangiaceae bacterium]
MPGVARQDGDGWARCGRGHTHWGRFGAVGLLAYVPASGGGGSSRVLLVRRSRWGQHGGTWAPPGGARGLAEPAAAAALREAQEESGLAPGGVDVQGMLRDEHGDGWSFETFVAAAREPLPVRADSREITEARWMDVAEVGALRLHPGFGADWPVLAGALVPVTIVVDVANVMGARADGWWRDRAGAAQRLHGEVVSLSGRGFAALPDALGLPSLTRWYPQVVFVVEGAARRAAIGPAGHVRVVAAPGSGDDTIAAEAAGQGRRLVVTADRELRRRCQSAGAAVTGPSWLLGLL